MPLFVYIGHDGPRGRERRGDARPEHLAHLETFRAQGRIRFAGPLLDEQGEPRGSMIMIEAESFDEARGIAESDPYLTRGVFERIEVHGTRQVMPAGGGA